MSQARTIEEAPSAYGHDLTIRYNDEASLSVNTIDGVGLVIRRRRPPGSYISDMIALTQEEADAILDFLQRRKAEHV